MSASAPQRDGHGTGPTSLLSNPRGWVVFLISFGAVWIAHWPLLRLPYYWDEAGYYIPAAFDFFRTGSLIPFSTLSNAHPPLPSIYLAACWKLFGFSPFVTRSAMCLVAALALTAVWRIVLIASGRRAIAATVVALTAIYPVFFAQSSLAHADLFAAAGTLWALAFFVDGRRMWPAVLCFSLAALSKETAIITPLALAAWQVWLALRKHAAKCARISALLALPVLPLALWYAYHWRRTGFIFGNPQYLRYNATATLSPLRMLAALWHRTNQITLHMNMFVPVLLALACLLLDRIPERENAQRSAIFRECRIIFFVVILANLVFFSVLGGALLTRYLLPLYPLVILLCVHGWRTRLRHWPWFAAFSGAAFITALFVNPPYRFAPEDNLAYRDTVRLQQDAISQIVTRFPDETVLTAWPASDELTKPELGYVSQRVGVMPIENFSFAQIEDAARSNRAYTVGLIFSTKYVPARWSLTLGRANQRMDARFFGFHRDLDPATIARLLGGKIAWREQRRGQWAAVLQFDRPQEARLAIP
ncbi:MAG TPA: glycosyltransferase family 39 protein [Silvibacterium sp.]|nr:glycosyltransferase family 39 protein [Silvibacterium sp.]